MQTPTVFYGPCGIQPAVHEPAILAEQRRMSAGHAMLSLMMPADFHQGLVQLMV